jgi:hypothetical protein
VGGMTSDELRARFSSAYKIIQRERRWREHVFRNDPIALKQKLAEMDRLLAIVTELKDELKPHCEPSFEQPALLDVPKKADYL